MILYHGSNVVVVEPKIIVSNRNLDYGMGFYATSSLEQAKSWADVVTKRRKSGQATVSVYELNNDISSLIIKNFKEPDSEWLDFVKFNRQGIYKGLKYDLVIGPVANDNTMPVLNDYILGNINLETALILLKPQKLVDQYAFLTIKSLGLLSYKEKIVL